MQQSEYHELIFNQDDIINLVMQNQDLSKLNGMIVDDTVMLDTWPDIIEPLGLKKQQTHSCSAAEWHARQQKSWKMPDEYKSLDIAEYTLSLCKSESELQRCGTELLLYQERGLFDLLRYLKYLVDVMQSNCIIWGVGRGSSVSSYVLYKLKVHRIDSLHYNLDINEFLR